MSPLGATAQAVGAMKVSGPAYGHTRHAQRQQQLTFRTELEELIASPCFGRVVAERTAVPSPEVSVLVHAKPVRLHEDAVAEGPDGLAVAVELDDRGVGSMMQPRAALSIRDDPDRRPPKNTLRQLTPLLEQPVGIIEGGLGRLRRKISRCQRNQCAGEPGLGADRLEHESHPPKDRFTEVRENGFRRGPTAVYLFRSALGRQIRFAAPKHRHPRRCLFGQRPFPAVS